MRFLIISILLFTPAMIFAQANRAQNNMAKGRFDDARSTLLKAIGEDSLASAEMYVLSKLYMNDTLSFHDVDSAYLLIQSAFSTFAQLDEKSKGKLKKDGYDSTNYLVQQRYIEAYAFRPTRSENTEEAYINYISSYPQAIQIDSAVSFRNARAYEKALATNTYQSYHLFFEKYPEANELPEATKRYHRLLFKHHTQDGRLNSFQEFLIDFPDTPHRDTCEYAIYTIITGANTKESLTDFLSEFPKSYLGKEVLNRLLYLDSNLAIKLNEVNYVPNDSLLMANETLNTNTLLIPDEDSYEVIDHNNNVLHDGFFDVSKTNQCNSQLPYIIGSNNGIEGVYNAHGKLIREGDYEAFIEEHKGILNLKDSSGNVVLHASGQGSLISANRLKLVGPFVAINNGQGWGMVSITNRTMLVEKYDSIYDVGQNIVLMRGGKTGLFKPEQFVPLLDGIEVEFVLPYDEVIQFETGLIHVLDGEFEGLLAPDLTFHLELNKQIIEELDGGYFIDRGDSTFDSTNAKAWIVGLEQNLDWTIIRRGDSNNIQFKNGQTYQFQEAELIGTHGLLASDTTGRVMMFADSISRTLDEFETIKPLPRLGSSNESAHYILSFDRRKLPIILDRGGKKTRTNRFKKVYDLGTDFMLAEEGRSYTLIDNQGKTVIRNLDGAKVLRDGVVSIFSDRQFGAYSRKHNISISRKYDKPLVVLNDSLFIATTSGKHGLIGKQDEVYLPIQFDDIKTLNDTLLIVNLGLTQSIIDLGTKKTLIDRLTNLRLVKKSDQDEMYVIERNGLFGIYSTDLGLILDPTFSAIDIIGSEEVPVYRAEKFIDEADLYILLYYSSNGKLFKKIVLSSEQYDSMICVGDVQ